jgi:hypothetical protein
MAYPGASKNVLRAVYGEFIKHITSCAKCNTSGLRLCETAIETKNEAYANINVYLVDLEIPKAAEAKDSTDRGSESCEEYEGFFYGIANLFFG